MILIPKTAFVAATQFLYPHPMDGRARNMMEHEIDRLLGKADVHRDATVIYGTYSLSVNFLSAADQDKFYRAFDDISDYSLDYILTSPDSIANKISSLKVLR